MDKCLRGMSQWRHSQYWRDYSWDWQNYIDAGCLFIWWFDTGLQWCGWCILGYHSKIMFKPKLSLPYYTYLVDVLRAEEIYQW